MKRTLYLLVCNIFLMTLNFSMSQQTSVATGNSESSTEQQEGKNGNLTDKEAILGILSIIEALQEEKALNPELIKEIFDIELVKNSNEPTYYDYSGAIDQDWHYLIGLSSGETPFLTFRYIPADREVQKILTMANICEINTNIVHERLLAMNLKQKVSPQVADWARIRQYEGKRFTLNFNQRPKEGTNLFCLSNLKIDFSNTDTEQNIPK